VNAYVHLCVAFRRKACYLKTHWVEVHQHWLMTKSKPDDIITF